MCIHRLPLSSYSYKCAPGVVSPEAFNLKRRQVIDLQKIRKHGQHPNNKRQAKKRKAEKMYLITILYDTGALVLKN